uniref:Uncharacterized protein n=1 Tax=Arundo donax TaxID=35708 RepID=A0A0A8YH87_ARUDO
MHRGAGARPALHSSCNTLTGRPLPACLLPRSGIFVVPPSERVRTASRHIEPVAALAPPRLRVVLRGQRHARRHGHVHRVARAALAALGRAPRRVRPRPLRQQPPPLPASKASLRSSSKKNELYVQRVYHTHSSNVYVSVGKVAVEYGVASIGSDVWSKLKRPWAPPSLKGCRTGL